MNEIIRKLLFIVWVFVACSCSKLTTQSQISFIGIKIGDSQKSVLETLSTPDEKSLNEKDTVDIWYYTYKKENLRKVDVSRKVYFAKEKDQYKVYGIDCFWSDPEVDEEGFLEGMWSFLKPCDLKGIRIYSTEQEVIKTFGEPKIKQLVTDFSDKTISSYIYDDLVINLFKKRTVGIYFGQDAVLRASSQSNYPIHFLKKYYESSKIDY